MARRRTQKEKTRPRPCREKRLENAAQAAALATSEMQLQDVARAAEVQQKEEEAAELMEALLQAEFLKSGLTWDEWEGVANADGEYPCPLCLSKKGCFARRADYKRHRNSYHCHLKPFVCPNPGCDKAYAQKTSLKPHKRQCQYKPPKKYSAKEDDPWHCKVEQCGRSFSDPSSLARHNREQHMQKTHMCPVNGCVGRTGGPRCIKRRSEFRNHLINVHGYAAEELMQDFYLPYEVLVEKNESDGSSKRASSGAPSRGKEDCAVVLPTCSATSYTGEIPVIFTPDSNVSTPGLSLASVSPSPSIPDNWYDGPVDSSLAPSLSFNTTIEGCSDNGDRPDFGVGGGDMATLSVDTDAGMNILMDDSYLSMDSNGLEFGDVLFAGSTTSFPQMDPSMGISQDISLGMARDLQELQAPRDMMYQPHFHMPSPDFSQSLQLQFPNGTGYGQHQFDQWDYYAPGSSSSGSSYDGQSSASCSFPFPQSTYPCHPWYPSQ